MVNGINLTTAKMITNNVVFSGQARVLILIKRSVRKLVYRQFESLHVLQDD